MFFLLFGSSLISHVACIDSVLKYESCAINLGGLPFSTRTLMCTTQPNSGNCLIFKCLKCT
uniref:Secreted protein n=1 Tax=Anguilla anguilla TaxID=7936 RepID=A0A0E9TL86_ANGAN